ncbi:CDP-alcohol phosphatidyltransferase family protein [Mycolicibacterium insubricum]|uniref:CDP-diacylglycerol--glycerol-3-phosphate 3-phosphatidyltransferase n=1 Tax=Mycolicibacterium insubricum TaxID=444597 RepID=A0A1X0DPP0_9MYCO|nr:CDP-alcohol phosphatidyltransferase family protein [Mycolicibacterium insubricum]ORA73820.1 CDP-diacylglycerol--glycerol-3-phosphate 3-phosphatidyltransferase [Mycolicibacterium insubricum]
MSDQQRQDRVLTVPNVLSVLRLALIPLFAWLLLGEQSYGWATAVLMFSGASDWADGKVARLLNQYSRLGELLDPAVDRIYMVVVPVLFAVAHLVPWWVIAVLMGRDLILAALLPLIRRHGVSALPVIYLGKAATFALMSAFPLILLGAYDTVAGHVVGAIGWGFLIWGIWMYLWSFAVYLVSVVQIVRQLPRVY